LRRAGVQPRLDPARISRTDRGDDEAGADEWKAGSMAECRDPAGDDDVMIVQRDSGVVNVDYLRVALGCDARNGT
jgi:hypothetical protein